MDKEINKLNGYVNEYYNCDLNNGSQLNTLLQKITGLLYYLETVRAEIKNQFEISVFELVRGGSSVARALNESEVKYPEMYQLRRIMEAGYRISDAIRTNISFIKSEMSHLKQH